MKTILIITPWFSPAFRAGGPIQSIVNMVEYLQNDFHFKIFTGNKDVDQTVLDVPLHQWTIHNSNTSVYYTEPSNAFQKFKEIEKGISYEYLFIIGLYDWQFNILPMLFCRGHHKIISVRGMLHPGALSQKRIKKRLFINFLKLFKINNDFLFHATNEIESKFIKDNFGDNTKVTIAPNFPKLNLSNKLNVKLLGEINLITVALISPMKNIDLVLDALKLLRSKVNYHIIGAIKDQQYWSQCKKIISTLPENINVIYHGELKPSEIEDHLNKADLFIMPSKSENYAHSIIESLSCGIPVITSKNTPWNNLQNYLAGMNVETEANAIAEAINYFINLDDADYQPFSKGALSYFNSSVDVQNIKIQYKNMFA